MPQTRKTLPLDLAAIAWDIATVPYSVARADTLDLMREEIRESGPDVAVEDDEGGGVHVLHDPAAWGNRRSDAGVIRGVTVRELVTITDPDATIGHVAHLAHELAQIGAVPCVKFHRNTVGCIDGFVICREVA